MYRIIVLFLVFGFSVCQGQSLLFEPTQLFLKLTDETVDISSESFNKTLFDSYGNDIIASKAFQTKDYRLERIFLIQLNPELDIEEVILDLQKLQLVDYVERVPIYQTSHTPNDLHSSQYNLAKVEAEKAWDLSKGDSKIIIAVVDDAVLLNHPDLKANIWTNPAEIPGNSIDDDGNGWVDDVNGYDFADNDNDPNPVSNASSAYHSHGTHCAGIVSAKTNNNTGISSIGYNLSMMAVKTGTEQWNSRKGKLEIVLRNVWQGVDYAIKNKANVISMSWGRDRGGALKTEQLILDVAYSRNIVCVAAAGNTYKQESHWPSSYNHVISVASTDVLDKKSGFSTYHSTVDISAPGTSIYSCVPGSSLYDSKSGTSMACPLVSGICGLMLSINPNLTPDQIETCLKSSADNINSQNPSYIGKLGAGRVNAFKALKCLKPINAYFTSNQTTICPGQDIQFKDVSTPVATAWKWSFPGGTPSTSTSQNPKINYANNGNYAVTLIATNTHGNDTIVLNTYIKVQTPKATISGNHTISAGGTAFLRFDFIGVPPFKVKINNGQVTDSFQSNSTTFYYPVSPKNTSTYNITNYQDSLCNGFFTGASKVVVQEGSHGGDSIQCLKITKVKKISDTQGNFKGTLSNNSSFGNYSCNIGDLDKDGINDIAIGAPANYYNGGQNGSVFICFMNADGSVKSQTEIGENKGGFNVSFPSFSSYGYWFGYGVHAIGDFNKDGNPDIAVSCNHTSKREGALWLLFLNADGTVKSYKKITNGVGGLPSAEISDFASFGIACDTLGDINGDGVNDLVVGGYRHTALNINSSGGIWILLMNANGTVKSHKRYDKSSIEFSGLHGNNFLGISVSNIGDLNKDGIMDMVIAASGDNDGGANTGAIFVAYLNSNGTIKSVKKLSKSNGLHFLNSTPLYFGYDLKRIGDINNDGNDDLLATVPYDDDGGKDQGAFYFILLNSDGTLKEWKKVNTKSNILTPYIDNSDILGMSIGLWSNNDTMKLFVSALGDDDGGTNRGAVYILDFVDTCENPCSKTNDNYTNKIILDNFNLHSRRITKSIDGNFLLLADKETNSYSSLYKTYYKIVVVQKLSSTGKVIWSRELPNTKGIGDKHISGLHSIIESPDGSIYVGHTLDINNTANKDFHIIKLRSDGSKIWSKRLDLNSPDYISSFSINKLNHNINIGGTLSSDGNSSAKELFCEMDTSGKIVWSKSYYTKSHKSGFYHLYSHFELNNSYYSSGWISPFGSYPGSVSIKKHDKNGNLIWVKYLKGTAKDYGLRVIPVDDNKIAYIGQSKSKGKGNGDIIVALFDTSGNEIWTKTYGTNAFEFGYDICYNENMLYAFGRTEKFYNGQLSTILIGLNLSGEIEFSRTFGADDIVYEKSTLAVKNGIILATTVTENSKTFVKIRKLNLCGESACQYDDVTISKTDLPNSFTNMAYTTNNHNLTLTNSNVTSVNIAIKDSILCGNIIIPKDTCKLTPLFTFKTTACAYDSIEFTDLSIDSSKNIQYWKWDLGNGKQITGVQHPKLAYLKNGTYKVKLIVGSGDGSNACFDSFSRDIFIKKEIKIKTSVDKDTICVGDTSNINTISSCGKTPYSYSWSPSTGLSDASIANPKATPIITTTYIVTVTDSNNLVAKDTIKIFVDQTCCRTFASFKSNKENYCVGDSIFLTENSKTKGNTTYKWILTPAAQISNFNGKDIPPLIYNSSGKKEITLITTDDCNSDTTLREVLILDLPYVDAGRDTAFCFPDTALLGVNNLSNLSYQWEDKTKVLEPNKGQTKAYITAPGTFYLYATESYAGCTNMDSVVVTSKSNFKVDLGNDTSFCVGDSVRLGTKEIGSYSWSTGETSQYIFFKGTGKVILTLTMGKCNSSDTIEITTKNSPIFSLGKDTTFCDSTNLLLKPNNFNPAFSYLWEDNTTDSTRTVNQAGTYSLQINLNGCSSSDEIVISKMDGPKDHWLGSDTAICNGDILTLNADQGNNFNYLWQDGTKSPKLSIAKEGYYEVVTSNECGTISNGIQVDFYDCNCFLIFPTAFTPNEKEPNNFFLPYPCNVFSYELTIYNRWGEVLFKSNDLLIGWDGTYHGKPVMKGNYLYKVVYETKRYNRRVSIQDHGIFTLLR